MKRDLWLLLGLIALLLSWARPDRVAVSAVGAASTAAKPPQVRIPLYSIAGIRPGMTLAQTSKRHKIVDIGAKDFFLLGEVASVRVDSRGIIRMVFGGWLSRDGRVLAHRPTTGEEVVKVLGKPAETWDNDSFCGNCSRSEWRYPGGLSVCFSYQSGSRVAGFRLGD